MDVTKIMRNSSFFYLEFHGIDRSPAQDKESKSRFVTLLAFFCVLGVKFAFGFFAVMWPRRSQDTKIWWVSSQNKCVSVYVSVCV